MECYAAVAVHEQDASASPPFTDGTLNNKMGSSSVFWKVAGEDEPIDSTLRSTGNKRKAHQY
jgi:hypothetical protein